jgi:hypothetical protein
LLTGQAMVHHSQVHYLSVPDTLVDCGAVGARKLTLVSPRGNRELIR